MNLTEMAIAARIRGMSYGKYAYLLSQRRVIPPSIEEVRARMIKPKKREIANKAERPVVQYTLKGEFVRSYDNVRQAAKAFGKETTYCIYAACEGRQKSAYKFQWRYAGDTPPDEYKCDISPMNTAYMHNPVDKVCEVCGKAYKGVGRSKYCSEECRIEGKRTYKREYMNQYRNSVEGQIFTCKCCGKEFTSSGKRKVYCSDECKAKWHWRNQAERRKAQNRK